MPSRWALPLDVGRDTEGCAGPVSNLFVSTGSFFLQSLGLPSPVVWRSKSTRGDVGSSDIGDVAGQRAAQLFQCSASAHAYADLAEQQPSPRQHRAGQRMAATVQSVFARDPDSPRQVVKNLARVRISQ
jgi:hypothetical protein